MSEGKTIKLTFLSVMITPPKQFGESCSEVETELGIRIDYKGYTKEECESDPSVYAELCDRTMGSDIVYIRCMGDPWKFKRFDRYSEVLRRTKAFVAPVSGSLDVDMMTSDLFSGSETELKDMERYNLYKSPENDFLFIWWLAWHFGYTDREPGPPVTHPLHSLYLNGQERFEPQDHLR